MGHLRHKGIHLLWLFIFPVLGFIYSLLNKPTMTALDLKIVIDHLIPVVPIFVLPYLLWYVFMFCYLIYFCFKDTTVYKHTLVTIVIGEFICFICYVYFQSTVARPSVEGTGMFSTLLQFVYAQDNPYNCFPSIHVLTTYTIMLASVNIKNKHFINTLLIQSMGALIILSTLFTKQHVIVDVVASMLIVSLVYSLLFIRSTEHQLKRARKKLAERAKTTIVKKKAF